MLQAHKIGEFAQAGRRVMKKAEMLKGECLRSFV